MKMLSAEEQGQIESTLAESREAFCWAMETAKTILRLGVPIDFDSEVEHERIRVFESRSERQERKNERRHLLKILDKEFDMRNKNDRNRLTGFLEHYEMMEKARKEKEARAIAEAERKRREAQEAHGK